MKFDLHTHTYYSNDATLSPEGLVRVARRKGLDGIAITDHNTAGAWDRVLKEGKKQKLMIIRGEEIKVMEGGEKIGETLALFINEVIRPGALAEIRDDVKSQAGLLIVAHPFDSFRTPFRALEKYKREFDAVEAINARVVLNRFNDRALAFASKNKSAMTAGSDCHCRFEVANSFTMADGDSADDLRHAILRKKTEVRGKRTNPAIHVVSTAAKLGVRRLLKSEKPEL